VVTYFGTSLERKSSSGNLLWDKLGEEASTSGNLALRSSRLPRGCDFMPEDVLSDLVWELRPQF
jgi:hypothetical protein